MVLAGAVTGTMTFDVAGQSGSGPVTGNHEYPEFSLIFGIALAGEKLTGRYAGKATCDNCTAKFGRRGWCRMEGPSAPTTALFGRPDPDAGSVETFGE